MITKVGLGDGTGAAFTDRRGGVGRPPYESLNLGGAVGDDAATVLANRRRVAGELGLDPVRVVWMHQVHGARVAFVTGAAPAAEGPRAAHPAATPEGPSQGASPRREVDGVVTTTPGLALAVLVADCAPVLLVDSIAGVAGAAHSGRPGTAAGVVPAVVEEMRVCGADPARISAAIGPAICGGCYEVPGALRDEVAAAVPQAYTVTRAGTPGLDLRAGILAQLKAVGVTSVEVDERCTAETPDLFSYRRDGRTGRFAGYVWLDDTSEHVRA